MTITYTESDKWPGVKFPKIHTVTYAETVDHVQAFYQRSYLDHLIEAWLKENCEHAYYFSPGYLKEKSVHFEDDAEAVMFALRWS